MAVPGLARTTAVVTRLLLLAMTACIGCVGGRTSSVTGRVITAGRPVPHAVITFSTPGAPVAVGESDAAGRYSLSTFRPGDGAVPGMHAVSVEPLVRLSADGVTPDPATPLVRPDIPTSCRELATTLLRVEVVAGQTNNIDLTLQER
jgi:hypothetical protein